MAPRIEITDPDVELVFDSYDEPVRLELLALRSLILDTADGIGGVGPIEETLKWGQPSYLTSATGTGSTLRIAPTGIKSPYDFAMFFICSTTLVEDFTRLFGGIFRYEGNRALLFSIGDDIPTNELRQCVSMALTYHQKSKQLTTLQPRL